MARTPEWSVFNTEDGLVHRLAPRYSEIAEMFMHRPKTKETEKMIRRVFTDCNGSLVVWPGCRVRVNRGSIGTETITCIACIASPMEPT